MSVVDFSAYKATLEAEPAVPKGAVRSLKGTAGRQSLAFEGCHEQVIDAVLDWLSDEDQCGPVELVPDSQTVMLIRKGSLEFIEAYRHSGRSEWYKNLPRDEGSWWMLEEDAGICQVGVLIAILTEQRYALAELLRDGIGRDCWRENAFMIAMGEEKDRYYGMTFG